MQIPEKLREKLSEGSCVAFVGAGLSMGAGLPSWKQLLRKMLEWTSRYDKRIDDQDEIEEYISGNELLLVAEELRDRLSVNSFQEFMVHAIRHPDVRPTRAHYLLFELPFAAILTTNYDTLLETAYTLDKGTQPTLFTHADYSELDLMSRRGDFYILKLHGTIDRIDTIVLGRNDYRSIIYSNAHYREHVKTLFRQNTFLFLGFSLKDPDLLSVLEEFRASGIHPGDHFALVNTETIRPIEQRRFERDYGIRIIPYTPSGADHPQVADFLRMLTEAIPADEVSTLSEHQATPLEQLTNEVKSWLEAIKYRVIEVEKISDRCISMIAEMVQGTVKQRVNIHCIGGEITAQDVQALREALDISTPQGLLISDKRISPRARRLATSEPLVEVFNLSGFLREKVWGPYFEKLEELVENEGILELYVEPAGFKELEELDGVSVERERYESLEEYIDQWLVERGKMHISLLGEFGSGKTWFCRHYAYRQLKRYLQNPADERLPLLITLRNFTKASTVQQLINDALLEQYELPFVGSAFTIFEEMNRRGKILLVLDGFDEMARQVNYQTIVDNYNELLKLVDVNSKVILTSRTEYFRMAKEPEKIFGGRELGRREIDVAPPSFEVLHLEEFSNQQIEEVIARRLGTEDGREVAYYILSNSNLAEMARKPILIDLLLAALSDNPVLTLENQAQVYLFATNQLLLRNIDTQRTFTSTADKLYFLCELAWEMIKDNNLRIHYSSIPKRISEYFGDRIADQYQLDAWDFDLRNQTLLHRDSVGYYEFAHKSLAEYFTALKFAAELGCVAPVFDSTYSEGDGCPCELPYSPKELSELTTTVGALPFAAIHTVSEFLVDIIGDKSTDRLWSIIQEAQAATAERVGYTPGNVATLLDRKGMPFASRDLSRTTLSGMRLVGADLSDANLEEAVLSESSLLNCNLSRVNLRRADLRDCHIAESPFVDDIKLNPTAEFAAVANNIAGISIWSLRTGNRVSVIPASKRAYLSVAWSNDGEYLAVAENDSVTTWKFPEIHVVGKEKIGQAELLSGTRWITRGKGSDLVSSRINLTLSFERSDFDGPRIEATRLRPVLEVIGASEAYPDPVFEEWERALHYYSVAPTVIDITDGLKLYARYELKLAWVSGDKVSVFPFFENKLQIPAAVAKDPLGLLSAFDFIPDRLLTLAFVQNHATVWNINSQSAGYGEKLYALTDRIVCDGLDLRGAIGLEQEVTWQEDDTKMAGTLLRFLADRGACLDNGQKKTLKTHQTRALPGGREDSPQHRIDKATSKIKANKASPQDYNDRGFAYFLLGDLEASLQDFETYRQLAPQDPTGHINHAYLLFNLDRTAEAEKAWREATSLSNCYAWGFAGHAVALWKLDRQSEAKQQYRRAIQEDNRWRDSIESAASTVNWTEDMIALANRIKTSLENS